MQTFPSVLAHLQARDVVVHTYAAVLTDALQTMKGEHAVYVAARLTRSHASTPRAVLD